MSGKSKETWDEYRRRTVKWAIRMEFAMLHSTAYRSLDYAPAVKVLNWFHEKRTIDVDKKKRGSKRYKVKVQDASFTYAEAALRGLDHKKFARALRELHAHGFIDVIHLGSGKGRDFSRYALSDRWRSFGTDEFKAIDFPTNISYVARDEVTKRWTGRSPKQVQRPKTAVDQRPKTAVEESPQRPECAVVDPVPDRSSTADIGRILSTRPCSARLATGSRRKVRPSDSRSRGIAAQLRHNDSDPTYPITDDPKAIADLAAALSAVGGHLPDEGVPKKESGRPRRNLDPNSAPILDRDYDPDLGPWAEDEAMTASIGRGGTIH